MDRFGEPPKTVQNLLAVANLKALAHHIYMTDVKQMGHQVKLVMFENAKINPEKISEILAKYPEELRFKVETNPYFMYTPRRNRAKETIPMMEKLTELLQTMQVLVEE